MMDNTAATFTGGIVVAALGGLTFIAYNHPEAYKKLSLFLNSIIILVFVAGWSWSLSNQWAGIAAYREASKSCGGKAYEIEKAVDAHAVPNWLFWSFMVGSLYVFFLSAFPLWLLDKQPPEH
jgi:hypothetical protein